MWKILLAFVIFAALSLLVLSRGGDIDMGGEKHGAEAPPATATPAPAEAAAVSPAPAASAAR